MDVPEIDIAEAVARIEAGAPVIDVRQPEEYVEGHVPGSPLVPLPELPELFEDLPTDSEVLVICRTGARSARATEFLLRQGIDAVNVGGGMVAWVEAGHRIVTGDQPGD